MTDHPSQSPILLDVTRLVWRAWGGVLPTGIDRTCLAYLAHYRERARAVVQRGRFTRVLPFDPSQRLFDIVMEQGSGGSRGRLRALALLEAFAGAPRRDRTGWLYLNVGHTGLDQPGHTAWLGRSGVRPIYFVHDLIPLTHPEYCRPGEPEKHRRRMSALLHHGAGIIGYSEDTVDQLARFAELQGASPLPSTLVAPLGVSGSPGERGHLQNTEVPERPYFIMLGTIEARKNHLLILTLWAELARRLGSACPQLVIIGKRGWECEQVVDMLERSEAIRGHVIELPRCDDAELAAYLRGARALLFPSFAEGYGLPLVEALTLGTPVIASDLAVFRELAGTIPDYLSPIDGLGWTRLIENYAQEQSPMRDAQRARMTSWAPPSWQDHFARVDSWLERLEATPRPMSLPAG